MLIPSHVLRNLSELDIENLQCGRITKDVMHEAARRIALAKGYPLRVGSNGSFASTDEMYVADELNDMLQVAREMREKNGGWVGV